MTGTPNPIERQAVVDAALDLFGASSTAGFKLAIPNTNPPVFVVAGEESEIRALLDDDKASSPQTAKPQFPVMLRKMWSGSEVQKWLDEQQLYTLPPSPIANIQARDGWKELIERTIERLNKAQIFGLARELEAMLAASPTQSDAVAAENNYHDAYRGAMERAYLAEKQLAAANARITELEKQAGGSDAA